MVSLPQSNVPSTACVQKYVGGNVEETDAREICHLRHPALLWDIKSRAEQAFCAPQIFS